MGTTYCMHIPVWYLPLHTLLYCLWHRYVQYYHTGIYHCVHTGIYLQNTSKMPTKICCWDNWLKHACTLHIRVHTVYIHVHTLYIGIKYFMLEPLRYFPLLSCLYSLHEVLYYASVQESAFLYMQGSYWSVLPKNGSGKWSAFLWHFAFFMYRRHCTWFHHVQALTYAYVLVFEEMLSNVQIHVSMHIYWKDKKLTCVENGTQDLWSSIQYSCLNHYASSVNANYSLVIVYTWCSTWRLVTQTYVLQGTSQAPRPRHDVTGQSLNMDLFQVKAKMGGEAGLGLGGANVSAHSSLIKEQPASWKVAGSRCCAVDTLQWQTNWACTR